MPSSVVGVAQGSLPPALSVPTETPRQKSATPKSSVADKPTEQLSTPTFGGILRGALPVLSLVAGLAIGRSFLGGTLYYLGAMGILGGLARSIPGGGRMTSWIATYIAEKKVEDKGRGSVRSEAPFAEGGKINIFSTDFQRWVEATYGEQLTTHYTTDMMRIVGAKPVVVNIGSGDKHTSRSAWQIPLVLLENWRVGGDSSSD